MSTMGKSTVRLSERMTLGVMCEDLDDTALSEMRETKCENENDIRTINLFEHFEDVDALKSRVQNAMTGTASREQVTDTETINIGDGDQENTLKSTSNCNGDEVNHLQCSQTHCDRTDCNEDPDRAGTWVQTPLSDRIVSDSGETLDTQTMVKYKNGNYSSCSKIPSGIKSGLVMSPITLTQDMPVSVANSNRFSRVLENMPLPLIYIPTTKQLVSGQNNADNCNQNCVGLDSGVCIDEANGTADCVMGLVCNGSDIDDLTQNISNINFNSTFGNGKCESTKGETTCKSLDVDTRTCKDPDQLTLHSVDCLIPQPGERLYTDVSSLSSVSTNTDFSVSAASLGEEYSEAKSMSYETEEAGFSDINLYSRNSYERTENMSQENSADDKGAKPKKGGISSFLSRNIFSRKPKEVVVSESAPGWKLFGRIPPKSVPTKDAQQISEEYQARRRATQQASAHAKKQDIEVLSTTGLIPENRPMNLPSKAPEEAAKHRLEYEAIVESVKRKEQREMRQKKKQRQKQLKQEDLMVAAASTWNNDILPNWEALHNTKKTRDLWWLGLPPNVRGKVWKLAIGNELNITPELYEICHSRAIDRIRLTQSEDSSSAAEVSSEPPSCKENSVQLIKLDVARTFPQLCIFQKGGPYYDLLHSLLGAYACYRPDVGYVQGMSFISAILLLNMDVADAFVCFANLLNRPCQVTFFRMDEDTMKAYYDTFEEFLKENLVHLWDHFVEQNLTPNLYLVDWIFLLYSKSLPLDIACRVWDIFCRDGEEFLFRTAIGILKTYESVLMTLDFIHMAKFLTKLPENICSNSLFTNIQTIRMVIDKKRFVQVLSTHKDNVSRDKDSLS
ncbi:TBC1 domain family member 12-like [Gigantopelta aegis]|uniref:TBC1 domain family member 12-like n=1 Tax=Gigantopelta aegis TaxID=1735272 RepID=UPI001B88CCA3|nr:TBC1 domain family member 12-like [Gigantopelta aegis]